MSEIEQDKALAQVHHAAKKIHSNLGYVLEAIQCATTGGDAKGIKWLLSNSDYLYAEGTALSECMAVLQKQMGRTRALFEAQELFFNQEHEGKK